MPTIQELLEGDTKRILPLADLASVSINSYWLTVNDYTLNVQKSERDFMKIKRPTEIDATVTLEELAHLEKLLREKRLQYQVRYIPPYYGKGQGNHWLATVELDVADARGPIHVTLVDFGGSYGKILVNDILVDISHSGGTTDLGWTDFTTGFHLVGKNRVKALEVAIAARNAR